jgi:hypothetical protein
MTHKDMFKGIGDTLFRNDIRERLQCVTRQRI